MTVQALLVTQLHSSFNVSGPFCLILAGEQWLEYVLNNCVAYVLLCVATASVLQLPVNAFPVWRPLPGHTELSR